MKNYPGIILLSGIIFDQAAKLVFASDGQLNRGIAFSLAESNSPWLALGLIIFSAGAFLFSWPKAKSDRVFRLAHALFFAGAFSNLIDRLVYGGVRDIWTVPLLGLRNNPADWLIVGSILVGAAWQLYRSWRETALGTKIPA
jgi:lipoprotein signal peptidase